MLKNASFWNLGKWLFYMLSAGLHHESNVNTIFMIIAYVIILQTVDSTTTDSQFILFQYKAMLHTV